MASARIALRGAWRSNELYGVAADIVAFTDGGMTNLEVGRKTFEAVLYRPPERDEFARLLKRRLYYRRGAVAESRHYRVLPGVEMLLPRLVEGGYLPGLVTGDMEAAAHTKLHRARMNHFFFFGGYGAESPDRGEVTRIAHRRARLVYDEALAPAEAIVVGDTPNDIEGAHAAGIQYVAVVSHHFNVEQLRKPRADYAIGSLEEGLPL